MKKWCNVCHVNTCDTLIPTACNISRTNEIPAIRTEQENTCTMLKHVLHLFRSRKKKNEGNPNTVSYSSLTTPAMPPQTPSILWSLWLHLRSKLTRYSDTRAFGISPAKQILWISLITEKNKAQTTSIRTTNRHGRPTLDWIDTPAWHQARSCRPLRLAKAKGLHSHRLRLRVESLRRWVRLR
jgi:hypothetical protein